MCVWENTNTFEFFVEHLNACQSSLERGAVTDDFDFGTLEDGTALDL